MKKKSILGVAIMSALVTACSHPAPVQYSVTGHGIPDLLTMTSTGTNEPQDFRDLYAKAREICAVSQNPVKIHSSNGSCDKGRCYYSMAFSCRETTQ